MNPTFVIGDIHGHYDQFVDLLKNDARVIKPDLTWIGGDATVCVVGDYFDRGPEGIRTVDFLISLQIQAEMHGGRVIALLGNHDVLIMGAKRFGTRRISTESGRNFYHDWKKYGGVQRDLDSLTPEHIAWLTHLPAVARIGESLVIHADSTFYLKYGQTIAEANRKIETILRGYDATLWDQLFWDFAEKFAFSSRDAYDTPNPNSKTNTENLLAAFGGDRIIHGHTPIYRMTHQQPETVKQALIYADGVVINVDGGMYAGGGGFIYEISP